MAKLDRMVAGLRCRDVLAELSEFLDGELPGARADQIRDHLEGCDWCEKFGGEMSAVVAALRETLGEAEPVGPGAQARLRERLEAEFGEGL